MTVQKTAEAGVASDEELERPMMHTWIASRLGHGNKMCSKCFITDREAAALGCLNECQFPEDGSGTARKAPSTVRDSTDHAVGVKPAHPTTPPQGGNSDR